jgi:hypothetical protein
MPHDWVKSLKQRNKSRYMERYAERHGELTDRGWRDGYANILEASEAHY